MGKKYFTSDPHWGHRRILEFCADSRPYTDLEDMHRGFITAWQNQVTYDDDVYIIGDVFFTSVNDAIRIMDQLPGRKHLILGNHDHNVSKTPALYEKFESVQHYLTLTIDKQAVILFHYPIWEWEKMHYGSYHLYGHVHGRDIGLPGRAMDVGVDTKEGNKLWEWSEIHEILKHKPIRSHHDYTKQK